MSIIHIKSYFLGIFWKINIKSQIQNRSIRLSIYLSFMLKLIINVNINSQLRRIIWVVRSISCIINCFLVAVILFFILIVQIQWKQICIYQRYWDQIFVFNKLIVLYISFFNFLNTKILFFVVKIVFYKCNLFEF